tara:strand:+ start:55 stop:492 length:438 start_codon:yes stop_codon:yes gene_type:complete
MPSSSRDSTNIREIMREIKNTEQAATATQEFRNPRGGVPIPQPIITGMTAPNTVAPGIVHVPGLTHPPQMTKVQKKNTLVNSFRQQLKQGILFFFLFYLCSQATFRATFKRQFPYFLEMGHLSTTGQIFLALLATVAFLILQMIF